MRIPVTWGNHQSAAAPFTIDPQFMNRVAQVVDWALASDLHVVLNLHHDSWQWISKIATDHDAVLARYTATWRQIVTRLGDRSRKLLFESVNEPTFDTTDAARKVRLMNELNTTFHSIVRQAGGRNATRVLILPTEVCTPDQKLMDDLASTIRSLRDPNIAATVHFYGFWPFSVNIAGFTRFDDQVQRDMNDAFARMRTAFVANGIPVYAGETGLLSYDYNRPGIIERGEALKFYEALGHQSRLNGVTTAMWDTSSFINPHHAAAAGAGRVRPDQVQLDQALRHDVVGPGLPAEVRPDPGAHAHAEPQRHDLPRAQARRHATDAGQGLHRRR